MPEGDTIWRTARRLSEALADEVIIGADLRWPGLSTADLRGMRTMEVASRGKNLLLPSKARPVCCATERRALSTAGPAGPVSAAATRSGAA
ncbi:MAG: hypothetical protein ABI903_12845 [Actinomycetota bacterium]